MVSCQSKLNSKTRDVTSDGNERMLSSHMAKTMALMLLDLVAPDVMYNGIPWPEQEFMRVTIERLELRYMYKVRSYREVCQHNNSRIAPRTCTRFDPTGKYARTTIHGMPLVHVRGLIL